MGHRAVITGAGVISALGDAPAELYAALCEGRTGLRPSEPGGDGQVACAQTGRLESFAVRDYLTEGSIYPLDSVGQLTTAAAQLALAAAGLSAEARAEREVGVAFGTVFGPLRTVAAFDLKIVTAGPGSVRAMDFANCAFNSAGGQAAIWHKLRGMNTTIMSGFASGLHAVAFAAEKIRLGRASAQLAGGAEVLSAEALFALDGAGLLCRPARDGGEFPVPFDARRNGLAPGEGAALLVVEEESAAAARGAHVLAEVEGFAFSCDRTRAGEAAASVGHLARTIGAALDDAGVRPEEIDALSASANGSPAADRLEAQAVAEVFGPRARALPVTAVKSMLGETFGASGALQTIAMLEAMRGGVLPGVRRLEQFDEDFPLAGAVGRSREVAVRRALVNSVGPDGACCSLVIARRGD